MKSPRPTADRPTSGETSPAELAVLDALLTPVVRVNAEGRVTAVNAAWRHTTEGIFDDGAAHGVGLAYRDVALRTCLQADAEVQQVDAGLQSVLRGDRAEFSLEIACPRQPGRWIRLVITPLHGEPHPGAVIVHLDISESRQAAEKARRLLDLHIATSRIHGMIARGGDLQGIYENACRIAVEQAGLRMAWVGLASADGHIRPTALWGHDAGYVELLEISGDPEHPGGRGPAGQAFRSGLPACCNDLEADDGSVQTRAEALKRGYRSCAAFPLAPAGRITGVLAVCSSEANFFGDDTMELLSLLAESLAHAMHSHELDQQRQRSEQALRASEASLAAAQQVGKVGSWETDTATLTVTWTRETHRIFETDPDHFQPTHAAFIELVHPEDRQRVDKAFADSLGKPGVHAIEHRLLMPDGRVKHVEERWQTFFDEQGVPMRAIGTCQEITERKLAEQQIQRSETLLRAVTDGAPDAIFLKDLEGRYLLFNEGAARLVGKPAAEVLGRDDSVLFEPADAELARASDHQVLTTGRTLTTEENLTSGGITRTYQVTKAPYLNTEGRVIGLIGIARDITVQRRIEQALRQSEENFRSLFDQAATGIVVSSLDGRFITANPAYCRMVGYSVTELRELTFADLTHPEDLERNLDLYRQLLAGKLPNYILEKRYLRKDGSIVWARLSVSARKDEYGKPAQFIAVSEDITELRQSAKELARHQALLRIAGALGKLGGWSVSVPDMELVWSDQMAIIHDVEPGETPDLETAFGFYHPDDREKVRGVFQECLRTGRSFEITARTLTAKGRNIWIRAIGEAVRDASGKIVRVQGAFQDISDQKTAALEIQRLGQRLTTTLESMTDAFYILDSQWRFVFLNPQAEHLLQRRRAELLGRELWVAFPESIGRHFEREYRRAMETGESVAFEEFYPSLSTWFEVHAYPSEEGLAVYFRDITERRRSEEALRQSEERFREMAENIDEVFFNYDPVQNRLLYASPAFARLWGRPFSEVIARPTSYLESVHPEDRAVAEAAFQRQLAGEATQVEFRILLPDGSLRWIQETAVAVKHEAQRVERVVGTMRDITAGKLAEERLREQATLLDKAQDAILVRDLDHRILYWNKSAERLYGWTTEEAVGEASDTLLYRDQAAFTAAHATTLERGEWTGELEQFTKDGKRLIVEVHWSLVRDDHGQPKSVLAINTDVTERKRIEQQFLRAQRMESIGTLAGGIAHDLNNVLAPILMSMELLKLDETRAEKLGILATVESSAQRGADMVRQVLSFARGVEGRQIRLQPAHLVREVAKIANETFLKSIRIVTRITEDLRMIQGDPTQLHQVLLNLCVNARDAMPDGGTLTLRADNLDLDASYAASLGPDIRPGHHVRLRVEDTGTGMPPEVLERIFDPFFTTKEPGKGTGLGLSTAQAIVRSHGGLLRAQSEPGEGTQFDLYLPALEGVDVEPAPPVRQLPRGSGQTVLVVDDEDSVRQIARQTLQNFGYRVLVATDGAEATAIFAARHREIEVVLIDMMMPVMDGAAAIQVLRRIAPGARILASSGLHVEAMRARAERAGVRRFIAKPYTAETLLQALHEVLTEAPPTAG